ncbi:MAG: isochorismatase family protein, partial [Nitrospinota bacterium]|nr:isochorismatase family protein [Nitrospinota bacterium]
LPSELVIHKLKPSMFYGTSLVGMLNDLKVDTLLVAGTTTSGCVRATVVDAFSYNYAVGVVEECVVDRWESSHAMTLFDLDAKYADVISLAETTGFLKGLPCAR